MLIEIVTFRLGTDADETAFLAADHRVQTEAIPNAPGFVRRTTARGADGEWVVVNLWDSEDDADGKWVEHPATREFMSFVDDTTLAVRRYTALVS